MMTETLSAQSFMRRASILAMVNDNDRARKAFARFMEIHRDKFSARALSTRAGRSPSAASQFIQGNAQSMRADTQRDFVKAAAEILERPVTMAEMFGDQQAPPAIAGAIPTRGEVAAGQWLDIDVDLDPADFEQFPITAHPGYPFEAQFGLIVRGTSINRVAAPGNVLHCLDLGMTAVEPQQDDLVIAERRRLQAGLKEVTAKRIGRRGRVTLLSPDSFDGKWKPIELDPRKARDGEEVAVVALVIGVYTPIYRRK
jgi:hypothetical protein